MQILAYMDRGDTYKITATKKDLARVVACTYKEIEHFISESKRTKFCDITERHDVITVVSRRLKRKYKDSESNRLRQQRYREKHSKKKSNATHNGMSQFPDIEVDIDIDIDIDKRTEEPEEKGPSESIDPAALGAAIDEEFDTEELQRELEEWGKGLEEKTGFNGFKFINLKNSALKGKVPWPAQCFIEVFRKYLAGYETLAGNIKNPWAYMETLWKIEAPNVLENLKHQALVHQKEEEVDMLSTLIDLIGK